MNRFEESIARTKPLCIDLFCGLGGWAEGALAEGYDVVGFDIERHCYGESKYPAQLVLQDVLSLHGRQFKDAALIVASPPCQEFSYMAMPFSRGKQIAAALRGQGEFPKGYTGSRTIAELTALFDACFRIQREASEAAGHHIPMVVENVKGAQPWVGRAAWHYGSYYLWGDVPALMPHTLKLSTVKEHGRVLVRQRDGEELERNDPRDLRRDENGEWVNAAAVGGWNHPGKRYDGQKVPGIKLSEKGFNVAAAQRYRDGLKHGGDCFSDPNWPEKQGGVKQHGSGAEWFNKGICKSGSRSDSRKAASAQIAKIPFDLARHIARVYHP